MTLAATQADIYTDFHGLSQLRSKAQGNASQKDAALSEVARQFETVFLKMMLKSMRDTVPESGLFDSQKSKFYESMYDDQISLDLSKKGTLGLADTIVRQLGGHQAEGKTTPFSIPDYRERAVQKIQGALQSNVTKLKAVKQDIRSPEQFIDTLWPHAQMAAKALGVDPKILLAQSALETGWGQHMIKHRNGQNSFNLFGIKASNGWQGKTVNVPTLEYENGVAVRKQATFRAYDSYEQSFNDYVQFLQQNPRYKSALSQANSTEGFVKGLQKAGYATDPAYAKKILSILNRAHFSELSVTTLASEPA